ncbi:MAG: family 1 glycosylhydrolase [Verrucomicrobiae bacterium]|nr:family 1 glycosylhydrolase [Verrucomicrobiae bacterium]
MKKKPPFMLLGLIGIFLSSCVLSPLGPLDKAPQHESKKLTGYRPFAWGISTSSLQYEDSAVTPGTKDYFVRDWDLLVAQKKAPPVGNALSSWSHFDKDLAALKKIGVNSYRFSIEWARVEPQPGVYNEEAIRRYVDMARQLKESGIEPVVCLWHFTFPAWLVDTNNGAQSNWLHPLARSRWNNYVTKMVKELSPYVKYYAPQNEPNGQILTAYIIGLWPPGHCLDFDGYKKAMTASEGMFRDAATRIKQITPDAKIMSVEAIPYWYRGPLDPGGIMYNTVEHNVFDHLDKIYDCCDIIGFNYYYSQVAGPLSLLTQSRHHGTHFSMMGWHIDPKALGKLIRKIGKRYDKPMMITENGIADLDENQRIKYLHDHIEQIRLAMDEGYDVKGYFVWSLADNYEWHYGYVPKFGLAVMDPKTFDRILKPSALYYRAVIKASEREGRVDPDPPSWKQFFLDMKKRDSQGWKR